MKALTVLSNTDLRKEMENNSLLTKLNDLEARFQEVSTLITDPAVVADMKRYVRLNKEYRELEQILDARKRYIQLLTSLSKRKYQKPKRR